MSPKRTLSLLLLTALGLGALLASTGCGKPYYVEGQDDLGELPDSLRVQIEEKERAERKAIEEEERIKDEKRREGVTLRELGEIESTLPLEFTRESDYLLRRGDRIQIEVMFYPELQSSSVVRPDGMVTAPGVGDVPALGRKPVDVASDIEAYYSRILRDPTTTVNVTQFGERRAYIFGWVNRPGPVSLDQRMTLTQALATSGSVHPDGKVETVVLLRRKSVSSAQAYRLDLRGVLSGDSFAADIVLQPDDVVYVPRKFVASMEKFVQQLFRGLIPIPELWIKTYDAIHVDERGIYRQTQ